MIDESLVTVADFKAAVELWRSKGHDNVVDARFEDGDMILVVSDYVDPNRAYFISVPFNDNTIFCLDADHYAFE